VKEHTTPKTKGLQQEAADMEVGEGCA
jgi:hypothetical protein